MPWWFVFYFIALKMAVLLTAEEQWINPAHYRCADGAYLYNDYVCPFKMCFVVEEGRLGLERLARSTFTNAFMPGGRCQASGEARFAELGLVAVAADYAMPAEQVVPMWEWRVMAAGAQLCVLFAAAATAECAARRVWKVPVTKTYYVFLLSVLSVLRHVFAVI